MTIYKMCISILASLCLLCFTVQGADKTFWQGESGGLNIHWTKENLTATDKDGQMVFSAADMAKKAFEADFFADISEEGAEHKYDRSFALLSLVGSIASLADEESIEGDSFAESRFVAIDLANSGQVMKLTDFFAESDFLDALLADSVLKKALAQTESKTPATLMALYDALEWSNISVTDCEYYLPTDFLSQFAFHHTSNNQVAIRLNLPSVDSACHAKNIQLGFYLPIPTLLEKALKNAKQGKAGFLMEQSQKIADGKSTTLSFSTATYARKLLQKNEEQPNTSASVHTLATYPHPKNTVTVVQGDTLYSIAKRYGHGIADIAMWNHLQPPYPLSPGQTLLVSPPADVLTPKDEGTRENLDSHTVVAGETLYGIARRYGYTISQVAAWNDLQPPYHLSIEQRLRVSNPTEETKWTWTYQTTIHPTLPEFVFRLVGEQTQPNVVKVAVIEIHRGNESMPFQTLSASATPILNENVVAGFDIEDMNFDGYRDMRLMEFLPSAPNVPYLYWLFEPQTGQFVSNSAFAEITSPKFDAKKKQIISHWRDGAVRYGTDYYQVVDNKPILVRQQEEIYQEDETRKVIVRERVGDDMKIISESIQENTENSVAQLETPVKQRIITASGVYMRSAPEQSASVVGKLQIGTVVKELARSDTQAQIAQSQNYWYQVEWENGTQGWIFGRLSMPFNPKQRAAHYQQIAQTRLQKPLSLPDQIDLTDFLARVKEEVPSQPEVAAELALSHLLSLQKIAEQMDMEPSNVSIYRAWLEKQEQQSLIDFDKIQGTWHVDSQLFWTLHESFYPLPIADRVAWAGAENPLGGECEGFFGCNLRRLDETTVKYLKFHPNGQRARDALNKIIEFVGFYRKEEDIVRFEEDKVELPKLFKVRRTTVDRTSFLKKHRLVGQIDKLQQLVERTSVLQ